MICQDVRREVSGRDVSRKGSGRDVRKGGRCLDVRREGGGRGLSGSSLSMALSQAFVKKFAYPFVMRMCEPILLKWS